MIKPSFLLKIERVIVLTAIFAFFILSLRHWDFFFVPNVDIYQYLCDARKYYHGAFPGQVHPQPLYSLLIYPISILFSSFNFPEIKAGIAINIVSTTFALYLTWLLSKRYLGALWRLTLMVLLITHPLVFYTAVNTTPEALLWLCVSGALFFYPSKANLAYLFAVLAAFVKYEGFALLAMLPFTDMLIFLQQKKFSKKKLKQLLSARVISVISIGCLVMWQLVTFTYNFKNNGSANFYFEEIEQSVQPLLDWRKSSRLIDLVQANAAIYNTNYTNNDLFETIILFSLFAVVGLKSFQKKQWALLQSVGFCLGYLFVHMIFPAYNPRYFLPILGFIFLYFCITFQWIANQVKDSKWIVVLIVLALSLGWLYDLWSYKYADFMDQDRYSQAEERLAGEWLNEFKNDHENYAVIAIDAQNIAYYFDDSSIKNPFSKGIFNRPFCNYKPISVNSSQSKVSFLTSSYPDFRQCTSATCLVGLLPNDFKNVLVIHKPNSDFSVIESEDDNKCFKKIQTLSVNDRFNKRFVDIYEYQKDICN